MQKSMPVDEYGAEVGCRPAGRKAAVLAFGLAAAAIVVLSVRSVGSGSFGASPVSSVRSDAATLKVDYMVRDTPTSASGGRIDNVASLDFFPNFILLQKKDGSGRVFFHDSTKEFAWSR